MGPWLGPLGIMLGLPGVCYALVYTCNAGGKLSEQPSPRMQLAKGHCIRKSSPHRLHACSQVHSARSTSAELNSMGYCHVLDIWPAGPLDYMSHLSKRS
jgi:hypothetical protein